MKLTIAGYGFVGKAHEALLRNHFELEVVDPKHNSNTISTDTSAVVVCVATPERHDGACDMQHVFAVIESAPDVPILIKSTISIEGWRELTERYPNKDITFSPEFLRAASAVEDLLKTKKILLSNTGAYKFWQEVFAEEGIVGVMSNAPELILAKCFRNSFLATKVSFFNQIYDLCQASGLNYDEVSRAVGADDRIGMSHTGVSPERGFGGHCFPKDTNAIVKTAEDIGVDLSLIREAIAYNKRVRKQ